MPDTDRVRPPSAPARSVPVLGTAIAVVLAAGVWTAVTRPTGAPPSLVVSATTGPVELDQAGHRTAAHRGDLVQPGASVVTGDGGHAALAVGGSRVLLDQQSSLGVAAVGAPTTLMLRAGSIGVSTTRAGAVLVRAGAVTVTPGARGDAPAVAVRIDRGVALRVASLAGPARLSVPGGARLSLTSLDEVAIPGEDLPTAARPLSRLDDVTGSLDAQLAPSLTQLDAGILALGRSVDADPIAPAVFGLPRGGPSVSELALVQAIATATGDHADRRAPVQAVRTAGGSWGVVARRAGVDLPGVSDALSRLLGVAPSASGEATPEEVSRLLVAVAAAQAPGQSQAQLRSQAQAQLPAQDGGLAAAPAATATGPVPATGGAGSRPTRAPVSSAASGTGSAGDPAPTHSPAPTRSTPAPAPTRSSAPAPRPTPSAAVPTPVSPPVAPATPPTVLGGVTGLLGGLVGGVPASPTPPAPTLAPTPAAASAPAALPSASSAGVLPGLPVGRLGL